VGQAAESGGWLRSTGGRPGLVGGGLRSCGSRRAELTSIHLDCHVINSLDSSRPWRVETGRYVVVREGGRCEGFEARRSKMRDGARGGGGGGLHCRRGDAGPAKNYFVRGE
jgi:hypothetical protein